METHKRTIYVMLSNTATFPAKILRWITKAQYNHASLSLEADLATSYSFARRWKYYPWIGGFVKETPYDGVFGRFPQTTVMVIPFTITNAQYDAIEARLAAMYANRKRYHYDWLGLLLVPFNKSWKRKYHYFCSAFVKDLLVEFGIIQDDDLPDIVKPNDFLLAYGERKIYEGNLRDFARRTLQVKEEEKTA